MKLFQKSALAVAIAAVPFLSVNAMEALDDATLSNMTGQAGVTIETQLDGTGISIGSIQYTDTDGTVNDGINTDGGSVFIKGINISAADGQSYTSIQKIDVDTHGNLVTSTTTSGGQKITVDDVQLRSHTQANTNTAGASLVSNLSMTTSQTGASYATVLNMSDTTNGAVVNDEYKFGNGQKVNVSAAGDAKLVIATSSASQITDLDVGLLEGAIQIEGLKMYQSDDNGVTKKDIISNQVIWAVGGAAYDSSGKDLGGGVYIQGSDSNATIDIASISIGGGTIGSVKINNMSQAGSVTRIYGH